MSTIIKQAESIQRIDQLIRLQATGPAEELASKLKISRTTLFRLINVMKDLNAPIEYDFTLDSYVYSTAVGFQFGFFTKKSTKDKTRFTNT
ncbi:HTH domain-containing protein [Aquimarina sp. U1-2]|uniref:HTH domain-containing protein n=1 Tax=Aquimarina sp. U1-2 TaxID=2823141 RepID=UPI001AECA1EA|nr:HTH domain-containing protein [Aquimarina sp. U1-2]MBP2832608.1 HTH domain-containing protein [Aquimarina sp. U1-2]